MSSASEEAAEAAAAADLQASHGQEERSDDAEECAHACHLLSFVVMSKGR